ncbi:hypothetical protein [Rhizobium sp. IBUN]|uniref:hypothetical protein n=1 Tax=Rhizobium sp. IBUN TaxID=1042326 RepID=UPI0004140E48|nr:hypothetical protein [Rhizobium sp. IBUN]
MNGNLFSPRDLIASNSWSSVLLTTYSLSLSFLEAIPLASVYRSYRNFTVISDIEGYRASLADVGAVGVGRDYDVVPVKCSPGVFHPKIALLADEKNGEIRATVGSGNLTFGGWGYNNEVIELLRPGRDSACFSDLASMLESMMSHARPGGRLECVSPPALSPFVEMARKAATVPGDGSARLLHTMDGPLLDQMAQMADDLGGAESIHVVSPFFSGHHGIRMLSESLLCERISVAVPAIAPSVFDFASAATDGMQVTPVACDAFGDDRSLHSKVFDIECARGRLIVSGSANATVPALTGANVEAVVARIHDRQPIFGWEQVQVFKVSTTSEKEPAERGGAAMVVEYLGGALSGRIFGTDGIEGTWDAHLASGARKSAAGPVSVAADGSFSLRPSDQIDPLSFGSSVQVIFSRGPDEIRGWLVLRGFLAEMNRRGPLARSIGRHVAGFGTVTDLNLILEFVARDPGALIEAAGRTGGGRADRGGAVTSFVKGAFGTSSALAMGETWRGGSAARHGQDDLIDALVRSLSSALPVDGDEAGDDEDEDANGGKDLQRTSRGGGGGSAGQRIRKNIVERAFKQLFAKVEAVKAGPQRAPGLYLLFDMIARIVPRSEEGDRLLAPYLEKWLALAKGARPKDGDPGGLDSCVATVVSRLFLGDPAKAEALHLFLQSWTEGEVPEEFALLLTPERGGLNEELLSRGTTTQEWAWAWQAILSTKTAWSSVSELWRALSAPGAPFSVPKGATPKEISAFTRYSARQVKPDKIYWMKQRGKIPGCRCGETLSDDQRKRLDRLRVATCEGLMCGRVVVDLSL